MIWVLGALWGWYLHKGMMSLLVIRHAREQQREAVANEWPRLVRAYEETIVARHIQLRWTGVVWLLLTLNLLIILRLT